MPGKPVRPGAARGGGCYPGGGGGARPTCGPARFSPPPPLPLPSPFSPPLAPLPSPPLGPGRPAPSPPPPPVDSYCPGARARRQASRVTEASSPARGPRRVLPHAGGPGAAGHGRTAGRAAWGGVGEEKGAGGQQPRVPAPPRPLAEPSRPCGRRAAQRAWLQRGSGASDRAGAGEARLPRTTAGRAGGEGAGGDLHVSPAGCGEGVRPSRAPQPRTLFSAGAGARRTRAHGGAPAWGSGEAGWPARGARSRRPSGSAPRGCGPAARVWFPFGAASARGSGERSAAAEGPLRAELLRPRSPGAEPARAACALRPQGGAAWTDIRLGGGKARFLGDLPSGCRPARAARAYIPRPAGARSAPF